MRLALRHHLINLHRESLRTVELLIVEVCRDRCLRVVKDMNKFDECMKECIEGVGAGEL